MNPWINHLLTPSLLHRREDQEQPPAGLRHRHGQPGDGEGRRRHPVTVQEIPEKEARCEVVERTPAAASALDPVSVDPVSGPGPGLCMSIKLHRHELKGGGGGGGGEGLNIVCECVTYKTYVCVCVKFL